MMSSADMLERSRLDLIAQLHKFLDTLERERPRFDHGEEHVLIVKAAASGADDADGRPLFTFLVTQSQERML